MGKKFAIFIGLGILVFFITLVTDTLWAMYLETKSPPMPFLWMVSIALIWPVVFADNADVKKRFLAYLKGIGVYLACYFTFPLGTMMLLNAAPAIFFSNIALMAFINRILPGVVAFYVTCKLMKK